MPFTRPAKRRILYLGDPNPGQTSSYRVSALSRLDQDVTVFDLTAYSAGSRILQKLRMRLPMGPLVAKINRDLLTAVRAGKPDVVFFDKPTHFTRTTIENIKSTGALTVNYNQDSPFGLRNDGCWFQYYRVFRLFDLHCLFRESDVARYRGWGLNYIKTMFSFEPAVQFPPPESWGDDNRTRQVSYIGSPLEERPQFLMELAEKKEVPVVIAGPRWQDFLSEDRYARYVSHGYLANGEYRENIWRSKINLGFVSHLNEDDIGHKCIEIAACGQFLMAVRTRGHEECFDEDREAVFFSSVEECADKARFYLSRPDLRDAIGRRAGERAVASGYDNDTQLARILNRLDGKADTGS
ncbi:MAG: glycosyltransferase [Silvibacterium sp.]|nr:glycosyltransferase [Silvibacterium sp.]MBV8436304.1 glycosyltransferase [Silvibacterium sp.]